MRTTKIPTTDDEDEPDEKDGEGRPLLVEMGPNAPHTPRMDNATSESRDGGE